MVVALRIQRHITEDREVMQEQWGVQAAAAAAVLPQ